MNRLSRRTISPAIALIGLMFTLAIIAAPPSLAEAAVTPIKLVAFGDSLTAGYQLKPESSFPAQLQVALRAKGYKIDVANGGVSGDTTANGLDRLEWTLQEGAGQGGADGVILELGANDALRGTDPKIPRANLDKIVAALKAKHLDILLAGMRAPNNWGGEYKTAFDALYPDLAAKHGVALYPYFLDGVRTNPELLQNDGLHPTAKGVAEIVARILPNVEALIKTISERKSAAKN